MQWASAGCVLLDLHRKAAAGIPRQGFGIDYIEYGAGPISQRPKITIAGIGRPNVTRMLCHRLGVFDRDHVCLQLGLGLLGSEPTWGHCVIDAEVESLVVLAPG